ncbi:MAG: hypothetical protein ACO1O6_06365 [Bacteroidota bacterium]
MKYISSIMFFALAVFALVSCEKEPQDPEDEDDDPVAAQVFDIVGQLQLNEGPHDLLVSGNYVFACRNDVISVIDITDVKAPVLITEINDLTENNTFESLALGSNNVLYAGCTSAGGIYMINIANPSSPQIAGKFNPDIYTGNKIAPLELFFANNTLWAAGSNGTNGLLVKYNIVNTSTISVNDYWLSNGSGTGLDGVWANSATVFVATANGFVYSLNANDISSGPLDSFTFTNEAGHEHWGKTLLGSGNNLYWADWGAGFVNINISNPSDLTINTILTHSSFNSQFPDAEGTDVYDVAIHPVSGKIFLANGWSGLVRIDPSGSGTVEDYVDYQYHQNYCLALSGDYAIMGNISGGITGTEKGIKIIKIQ